MHVQKTDFEEKFIQNEKIDLWLHDVRISQKYRFATYLSIINELNCRRDLLEIGCGNGHFIQLIKQNFNFNLYGLDISSIAIKNASQFIGDVNFSVGELPKVDYFNKKFFLICILEVLYYIKKQDQINSLYNSIDCLENDGYILLSVVINHTNYINEVDFLNSLKCLKLQIHKSCYLHHKFYNLLEKPFLKIHRKLFLKNSIIFKFISFFTKMVINNYLLYKITVFISMKFFFKKSKSHLILLVGRE